MTDERPQQDARPSKRLHLKPYPEAPRLAWTWQTVGAIAGLAGGFVSLLFGMACSVLGWLSASARAASYLRHYGTVLIIIALPLLVLGAHALDLTDSAEKREKEFSRDRRDE